MSGRTHWRARIRGSLGAACLLATGGLVASAPSAARADPAPCDELAKAVDLSMSPLDDRRVFCAYAKDLVVGSCCQSSLRDCLLAHPGCAQAQALAQVGLSTIATGATEEGALAAATHYLDLLPWQKRTKLDLGGAPGRGDGNITVVEFSDFDCPHCAAEQPAVDKLIARRPDVRLRVVAFPIHPHAELAAAAALYAAKSGKYWQMSQALYATQGAREGLGEDAYIDQLVDVGKSVGLDPKGLRAALHGGPELDLARAQGAQARALKLEGTPTLFVDGRQLDQLSLAFLTAAVGDEADYRKAHPPPH
ncbi:MAG TPA: thioredoxin domain-containing protein [Myxococcales bacterium]|nr:thioredoxin domain-containing protein [Myxococcales bacterium]